jgi:hypothetical protein
MDSLILLKTDVIGTDVWECTTVSLLLQKLLLITIFGSELY